MTDTVLLIYSPFPTLEAARIAATTLLEEQLVACCNLTGGESHYRWQGELSHENETYLLAKTTAALQAAAMARIAVLHPHESPAILTFEAAANAPFAAWVAAATQK